MRIIAGRFGGRKLLVPKTGGVRPSTDRVRESIFSLVSARLDFAGTIVLDLFCGTGALGLEAISRGAASAVFVDANRDVLRTARENAARLDVADVCTFHLRDVRRFAKQSGDRFDLAFADPPYGLAGIERLPEQLRPLLQPRGLLLLEHDKNIRFEDSKGWIESRTYGRTIVSIFGPTDHDK